MDYGEGPEGRNDFISSELSPEKCSHTTRLGNRIFRACPPVAGYQLIYGGNEARPDVIVISPNRKQHVIIGISPQTISLASEKKLRGK